MGLKTREVVRDANLLSLNICVLLPLSSQVSTFLRLCIMKTLLHFLLSQSCHYRRNVSLRGWPTYPLPGLDHKVLSLLAEYDDVVRGPPFQPCLGPPNPESTTAVHKNLIRHLLQSTQREFRHRIWDKNGTASCIFDWSWSPSIALTISIRLLGRRFWTCEYTKHRATLWISKVHHFEKQECRTCTPRRLVTLCFKRVQSFFTFSSFLNVTSCAISFKSQRCKMNCVAALNSRYDFWLTPEQERTFSF